MINSKLFVIFLFLLIIGFYIPVAHALPVFDSDETNNSISDNEYPKINVSQSIMFNASTSGGNDNFHNWTVDGTLSQTNTTVSSSTYTTSFTTKGLKNVSVVVNNLSSPAMYTWLVLVRTPKTTGSDTLQDVNVTPLDDMMDAIDEADYEKFLGRGIANVYVNVVGAFFYLFLFGTPLIMMWISQEKKEIPAVLTIIFGGLFTVFIPGTFIKYIIL